MSSVGPPIRSIYAWDVKGSINESPVVSQASIPSHFGESNNINPHVISRRTRYISGVRLNLAPSSAVTGRGINAWSVVVSVRIDRLSKAYGAFWALKEVKLDLEPGEWLALLGPNGAGKTTLLRLLAGLTHPTTGSIELFGHPLPYGNSPLRSEMGFLTSGNHLYENLTVSENLRFFVSLYCKNTTREEREHVLNEVGLHRKDAEYVSALSHGMRSRLGIAKWWLINPKLLLVDEPYGALDALGVAVLNQFLQSLCAGGGTVVLATHDIPGVLEHCSRAIILSHGRIVFDEARQDPWDSFHNTFKSLQTSETTRGQN